MSKPSSTLPQIILEFGNLPLDRAMVLFQWVQPWVDMVGLDSICAALNYSTEPFEQLPDVPLFSDFLFSYWNMEHSWGGRSSSYAKRVRIASVDLHSSREMLYALANASKNPHIILAGIFDERYGRSEEDDVEAYIKNNMPQGVTALLCRPVHVGFVRMFIPDILLVADFRKPCAMFGDCYDMGSLAVHTLTGGNFLLLPLPPELKDADGFTESNLQAFAKKLQSLKEKLDDTYAVGSLRAFLSIAQPDSN